MSSWIYILIVLLSLGLLAFLLWKELARQNRGRLIWRVLCTVVAVGALCCFALPLHYQNNKAGIKSNEAILLTEGYNDDSVAAFIKARLYNVPVLSFDPAIVSKRKQVSLVFSLHDLQNKGYSAVHVFGYGMTDENLLLEKQAIVFHPSPLPAGITEVNWPRKIVSGNRFFVQGKLHNPTSKRLTVFLTDANTLLDSITVAAEKETDFHLSAFPKQLGRGRYSLIATTGKDTIEKETITFETSPAIPLKVLFLASSPDFENKFLKNWLTEKGYEVVVRTDISKNKYAQEFINTSRVNTDHINAGLLENFSVLVADANALSALSATENQSIRSAVQQGKGLIIKTDTAIVPTAFYHALFPLLPVEANIQHKISLHPDRHPLDSFHALPIEQNVFIRAQNGTLSLVADKNNHVLVNKTLYGSGNIILSTLPNTFSWMLSGNQQDYDALWSELLTQAAPAVVGEEVWTADPELPRVNESLHFSIQSAREGMPGLINGETVFLRQDAGLPFLATGTYWPAKPGWISGTLSNGERFDFYVYPADQWKTLRWAEQLRNMQEITSGKNYPTAHPKEALPGETVPFPAIIFFVLFLLAAGYLWFENKYYNS